LVAAQVGHPPIILSYDLATLRGGVQEFTIGRGRTADLVLNLPVISSKHATLTFFLAPADNAVHVVIIDTSTNGIWVNGGMVGKGQACEIRDGDIITLTRAVSVSWGGGAGVFVRV
jgi:pSer/pThr/pTyr-binding forkhead associated (FHA) protein